MAATTPELVHGTLGDTLVFVVLFGSVARGEAHANSDIDLLIVGKDFPHGRFARLRLLERADCKFEREPERLRAFGLDPRLTRLLKARREADRSVPLYLDMVEDAGSSTTGVHGACADGRATGSSSPISSPARAFEL